jgi:hypothetical protein
MPSERAAHQPSVLHALITSMSSTACISAAAAKTDHSSPGFLDARQLGRAERALTSCDAAEVSLFSPLNDFVMSARLAASAESALLPRSVRL